MELICVNITKDSRVDQRQIIVSRRCLNSKKLEKPITKAKSLKVSNTVALEFGTEIVKTAGGILLTTTS